MSRPRAIGLLLVLVTLVAYLPVLRDGFLNLDDPDYVSQNLMVQRGVTWPGIKWAFTAWHASNWHPLTWLSHMADCELFRLNPAGHHLVNALFHAANAGLLFLLWLRLTNALWPGAVIAALFAWHPLHVESVAWVSERKDVLSTFFALLALLSYVRHAKNADADAAPAAFRPSRAYWLALVFFALSLMAKPMLVTLPFVMLLLDYWPLQRPRPILKLLIEKWPFLLLTLASCAVTVLAQRAEAIAPLAKFSLSLRLENVVTAYAGYLLKAAWPAQLAVFYPMPKQIPWPSVAAAAVLLLGISAFVWLSARRWPYLLVGWLWYLGTLVPVIGLVQVGDQSLADRYTYFPLIGIFFAVTFAANDCANHFQFSKKNFAVAAGLLLAACLFLTENQLRYWRDNETLFTHALAVTQDNAPAHLNLGAAFQEQNRLAEALAQYREVLRLAPSRHETYNNIGRILNDEGLPAEALNYCQTAVALDPKSPLSHNGLGIVLAELRRFDEAMREFSKAARLDANYSPPHFQMGRTLLKLGRDAEAVAQFREALRIDPDNFQMLIYVARVLAADENPQARNGPDALALAQRAAQLAGDPQPVVLDTLAMACAEAGRFDEAAQAAQQAVNLALASGANDDAADMRQRLALYQKHQPWRKSFQTP
jgi:tetratricopeptide (TPR) repeat protein